MLYDHKRWDKPEVKADPFSLESLIAWLEKQPADKKYDYSHSGRCMAAQFFGEAGASPSLFQCDGFTMERNFWPGLRWIAQGGGIGRGCAEWTFGAALDRARKALAERG